MFGFPGEAAQAGRAAQWLTPGRRQVFALNRLNRRECGYSDTRITSQDAHSLTRAAPAPLLSSEPTAGIPRLLVFALDVLAGVIRH